MKCPKCQQEIESGVSYCIHCGEQIAVPASEAAEEVTQTYQPANPYGSPAQAAPQQPYHAQNVPVTPSVVYGQSQQPPSSSGKATGAFVCGIVAIVCLFVFPPLSIVLGIIAIALGSSANKEQADNKANAGKVMGIVSLVMSIIEIIVLIVFGSMIVAALMGSGYINSGPNRPPVEATHPTGAENAEGTWYIVALSESGTEYNEGEMGAIYALGLEISFDLNSDGKAILRSFDGDTQSGTWEQSDKNVTITIDGSRSRAPSAATASCPSRARPVRASRPR